ncbi:hypothetical protein LguiB_002183 [Lonicera macranthoides]
MSDYVAPDVWTEILTRLQLKNILQCTVVCKSWYSLITSPNFIATHLNRTIAKNERRLLIRESVEKAGKEHYSAHWDNKVTFDEYAKFDFNYSSNSGYLRIVGSSNGLVLFSDDRVCGTRIMYLWNPSIRKSVILPQPTVSYMSHGAFMHALGFGFHANDYKIVRVVHLLQVPGYSTNVPPPLVELYELSTGSWRRITAGEFPYVINECASQAFLNGVVHWFGFNPDDCKGRISHLIVSFNLRNEALGALMVPACVQQDWDCHMRVAVYGESLSLIHKPSNENSCNI